MELKSNVGIGRRVWLRQDGTGEEEYIIAQVMPFKVALIHLKSGNRFCDPIKVDDVDNFTMSELNAIFWLDGDMRQDHCWVTSPRRVPIDCVE
jgi:hypothetical protein